MDSLAFPSPGPICIFGALPNLEIVTVAQTQGPVTSFTGTLKWHADLSYQEAVRRMGVDSAHSTGTPPRQSWLLLPGGWGVRKEILNQELLSALRQLSAGASLVMSVCTGSALLAAAGLLEGHRATTNKSAWAWVKAQGPPAEGGTPKPSTSIEWVRLARWVESGRFVTAAGITAGMDMAVAIVRRERGDAAATWVARRAEYEAHEDASWDPFGAELAPDA